MPIYEFYCEDCHTIFNFFSKSVNTTKRPKCPACKTKTLSRQMSAFAFTGKAKEDSDMDDLPFDEGKMEQAMNMLAGEAENINEDDPRQAANLMRKLTDMTGMELGPGMVRIPMPSKRRWEIFWRRRSHSCCPRKREGKKEASVLHPKGMRRFMTYK